jgi:hypothetical protein
MHTQHQHHRHLLVAIERNIVASLDPHFVSPVFGRTLSRTWLPSSGQEPTKPAENKGILS